MSGTGGTCRLGEPGHLVFTPGCRRSQARGCHATGTENSCEGALRPGGEGERALACSEGTGTLLQPGLQIRHPGTAPAHVLPQLRIRRLRNSLLSPPRCPLHPPGCISPAALPQLASGFFPLPFRLLRNPSRGADIHQPSPGFSHLRDEARSGSHCWSHILKTPRWKALHAAGALRVGVLQRKGPPCCRTVQGCSASAGDLLVSLF